MLAYRKSTESSFKNLHTLTYKEGSGIRNENQPDPGYEKSRIVNTAHHALTL
jgi:hypothetical protein